MTNNATTGQLTSLMSVLAMLMAELRRSGTMTEAQINDIFATAIYAASCAEDWDETEPVLHGLRDLYEERFRAKLDER